jgi:CRISPR-associated protein Csb2
MPTSIIVRLRHGRYDAGGDRPSDAEWPPHPARVFSALAAAADGDAAWSALRWLEAQPAPEIWADPPDRVRAGSAAAYVVKNATHPQGGGNLSWPGRDNGMRTRAFAVPATASFAMVWPHADPADVLAQLRELARLVPYVGRSTSLAEVSVSDSGPADSGGWVVYEAVQLGDPRTAYQVRIPYVGYADELQVAYVDGRRSWEVARAVPYAVREQQAVLAGGGSHSSAHTAESPFEDLMVWTLARPITRINGDQTVGLASALRNAVMSRIPDPIPAQVSGHGAPGRPHLGFLALPDVGHDHADGHILGLALAIPRDMPPFDLAKLIKAVIMDPLTQLRLPGGRSLTLQYGADRYGLQPARWEARSRGGSREWVTATPVMLDGHLRRGRDEASEVARSLAIAGYPRLADVEVSAAPLVEGGVRRPRPSTLPATRPHRRLVHARVAFTEPVMGPVLAGSMRYLGLGLFLPAISAAPPTRRAAPQNQQVPVGGQPGNATALLRPVEVAR